jgi:trk system potassium uptake protein TrkH
MQKRLISQFFQKSDALYLLAFFLLLIGLGTGLLMIPSAWAPLTRESGRLKLLDAAFIATSAVCVTGLSVVNIADFSRLGQGILIFLVQIGGLGIISVTSILLSIPGHRLALWQRNVIQGFYIDGLEYRPRRIVRNIVILTLWIEGIGALMLALFFRSAGVEDWVFMGFFHGISAFCNAGFSPFAAGLSEFSGNVPVLTVCMVLIILGGLGFNVLQDIIMVITKRKSNLNYHSRVVLIMTAALILGGALVFWVIEGNRLFESMSPGMAFLSALFQSVTPRTAGFEILPQKNLTGLSKMLTDLLMLIGGSPGSIAGGLKVTTIFVIAIVMMRKPDKNGDINISHHRLTAGAINQAVVYFLKATALLLVSVAALFLTEGRSSAVNMDTIIFESISAFSTVGLTLGLTPNLSMGGRVVIIAVMFAGRVGLIALAFPSVGHRNYDITYPEGSVLLG